VTRLQVFDL